MVLAALICTPATAGSLAANHFSELDGSFNPSLPGRAAILFDQSGTQLTDLGINAFSDPVDGRITSVAVVDINNADSRLVGIGLARHLYTGAVDTSFQGTGKRVKDAFLTQVVDACVDPNGRIVVAGMTPGANGSAGNKDLALVRFNADGSDDTSFAGDGGLAFSWNDGPNNEYDEAILDLECLPNGNIVVAGWHDSGIGREGFLVEKPANGDDTSVHARAYGNISGYQGEVSFVAATANGIVASLRQTGPTDSTHLQFLTPNGSGYVQTPGHADVTATTSNGGVCGGLASVQFFGATTVGSNDYVVSGVRHDGVALIPMLMRVQFGENTLIHCTDLDFGVSNAFITPPVVIGDLVFVALGLQPLASGPLTSRLRAYRVPSNGSALTPAPGFGIDGMAQWSYPYNTGSSNNNRSLVQRLFVDPGYGLMAVGSRIWNGNDTDVVLARFGSAGVFNDGYETMGQ
jgi:hypothetical protein